VAIVVEDGTIVAGANSYLTLVEVRAFAEARGLPLSATDSVVEAQLIKASDYIEARESKPGFIGCRVSEEQVLCWPRNAYGVRYNQIPAKIKQAQGFLVMAQAGGVDVVPVATPPDAYPVTKEKAGQLETAYAVQVGATVPTMPKVPAAEEALAFYYASRGSRLEVY
jgi:hypothetical protein